jgi:transcriptional regulator with PAS, ATPase and Fis domain
LKDPVEPGGEGGTTTVPERAGGGGRAARTPTLFVFGLVKGGEVRAHRIALGRGGLTIGRGGSRGAAGDAPQLGLADPLLSRTHLRITPGQGGYEVVDAGSMNGTTLDGRRVGEPRRLSDGSILCFGAYAAVFRRVWADQQAAMDAEARAPFGPVAATSPALALTLDKLRRLARTDAALLLVGETGVGKEVYARAVHRASGRKGQFVAVNCAALPAELVESELYGYARGAHSTATEAKPGLVESADGGTLLLDEIAEMPTRAQAKILRFLQEREIVPLGSSRPRRVDVRVLAATSGVAEEGSGEALRSDLLARLGAEPIEIPPLRDRIEDVAALVAHFAGGALGEVEPAAFRALCLHGWPLNVRELESSVRRALALSGDGSLRLQHLPAAVRDSLERGAPVVDRRRAKGAAPGRGELEQLLREHRGNVAGVARSLGRQWNTVWRWLVRHELEPNRFRE